MVVGLRNINNNYEIGRQKFQGRSANNVSFDGRFAHSVESFANKLASNQKVQKYISGRSFNKFLKTSLENPGLYEALIALGVTCTARPLTVLATPGAKMEDKQYASAQSISSGIVGLVSAYLMFGPINKALDDTLVTVNGKNVDKAFTEFYNNKENAKLIDSLIENNVIPDRETFKKMSDSSDNLYGAMKKFFVNNGQKQKIEALLTGDDVVKADNWRKLADSFSGALNTSFQKVKNLNVEDARKYLVHEAIKFQPELKYNIVNSKKAEQMKFILGYSSKFIVFPLLAMSTVWAIPKIMKTLFPNHKKFKKKNATPIQEKAVEQNINANIAKSTDSTQTAFKNSVVFNNFKNPAGMKSKQVSFTGAGASVMKGVSKVYEKAYKNPLSAILNKIYSKIVFSKSFSKKMDYLFQNDVVKKHGMEVLNRNSSGKILKKYDTNAFVGNLSDIIAIWGSCLYIFNTIRNKEIEKDRKPALCTNMALVAMFSFFASKHIGKITDPIFSALQKAHSKLLNKKINYDAEAAWKCAKKILITTFAFRYLGPVLATPAADKVVKLFNNPNQAKQKSEPKKA